MAKILVVDDVADNVKLLTADLGDLGYDVLSAYSGAEALEVARTERPDCILLDVMMPEMDGLETCRRLKSDSELASVPVIMVSARDGNDDIIQGLTVGACDYITKPIDREIVAARVAAALRTKTIHDNLACSNKELDDLYQALDKSYKKLKNSDSSEKQLLKQTLQGCVKILIQIVHQTHPVLAERSNRLKTLVKSLVQQILPDQSWEIEIAAMLAFVGSLGVPIKIVKKHHTGQPLSPEELAEFQRHPQLGHDLVANIPQLSEVATIILYQEKSFNGDGMPFNDVEGDEIPLGARILKVASDYDLWIARRASPEGAVARLRGSSRYDQRIIEALETAVGLRRVQSRKKEETVKPKKTTRTIAVANLVPGMVLAEDLCTSDGLRVVLPKGEKITDALTEKLTNFSNQQEVAATVEVESTETNTPALAISPV